MRRDDPVRRAAIAHTNLTILASVVSILEGGNIYGGNERTAKAVEKIVKISQAEQGRLLREYDAACVAAQAANTAGATDA